VLLPEWRCWGGNASLRATEGGGAAFGSSVLAGAGGGGGVGPGDAAGLVVTALSHDAQDLPSLWRRAPLDIARRFRLWRWEKPAW
jgi:hypothetical protein